EPAPVHVAEALTMHTPRTHAGAKPATPAQSESHAQAAPWDAGSMGGSRGGSGRVPPASGVAPPGRPSLASGAPASRRLGFVSGPLVRGAWAMGAPSQAPR